MNFYLAIGIKIIIAVLLAILYGNGAVVMFNRFPVRWFMDRDETGASVLPPSLADAAGQGRQRLPSTPWKYLFTAFFGASGIFLALRESLQYEAAVLTVLVLVLLMAIADALYRIVPDQLAILLAVASVGMTGLHAVWWEPLPGAAIGLLLSLSVWGIGRLIYRKDVIGGADIKFYLAIGLAAGRKGVLLIFMMTQLLIGLHAGSRLLRRSARPGDQQAMLPYAFAAVTIFFLFLWNAFETIVL